jgi:uncharacterized protein (TIGR00255 family)
MRSMTGFGVGACQVGGRRLVVEIRSVNHRFFDLKLRLPWSDAALEASLSAALRRAVERGALTVQVRDEAGRVSAPAVTVNVDLARQYHAALERLRAELGLVEPVSLSLLAQQRDVIALEEGELAGAALWAALTPGVEEALRGLDQMRRQEGGAVAADLLARCRRLGGLADEVATLSAESPAQMRARLEERITRLGLAELDPDRMAHEIALLADRIDISEEIQRLRSHLRELERMIGHDGPVGRKLDFLLQEAGREVNTMASKAQAGTVSALAVEAKAELEKMREQVQNVE